MNKRLILLWLSIVLVCSPSVSAFDGQLESKSDYLDHISQKLNFEVQEMNTSKPVVFKLLTYNIHFTGDDQEWRDVVIEENADIVQMSETSGWETTSDTGFVRDIEYINSNLEAQGYEGYSYTNVTYEPPTLSGGAAIISRYPIIESYQVEGYFLDDGTLHEFQHPILHTVLNISSFIIHTIGAVHFTPGETGAGPRALDMESMLNYIDAQGPVPFIFNGDFNTMSPQDLEFDWVSQNLDPEAIEMLIDSSHPKASNNHTWIDTYRTLNPNTLGATYTTFFPWESRIDYIFVNQYFAEKIVTSTTGDTPSADIGSDHYAVDVVINLTPEVQDLRPPLPITTLQAEFISNTETKLTWSESNDTSSYNVWRNNSIIGNTSNTFFDDMTLEENQLYKYEITATDAQNNTSVRTQAVYYHSSTGIKTIPGAPVINGESSLGQVNLNWSLSDTGGVDIQYYIVLRASEATLERNIFRVQIQTSNTEFVDEIDRVGRNYYYRVFAVNSLGKGMLSDIFEIFAMDTEETSGGFLHFSYISTFAVFTVIVISRKVANAKQKSTF